MTHTQAATLMIQGTTSDAGKSVLVAGFCRCLKRLGYQVAPFKPQNMALNSAVTADGGEIGRAQALQAQAAGVAPHVDMNPVLLKPSSDTGAQVIVHGKAISNMQAQDYHDYKKVAMQAVLGSHQRLSKQHQVIMVESAVSSAEINIREGDIANMGLAKAVDCPVIIVADIDKGSVFAHLVGTLELLSASEQNRVVGFVINKFCGDIALLQSGLDWLEKRTRKLILGVLPYLMDLQLAEEDAIQANQMIDQDDIRLRIAVPVFSRISNHTDFDMLRAHPQIELTFVIPRQKIPAADLIILPGSKYVIADLKLLRQHGWYKDIVRHLRYGGKVLGICGGYQMLGQTIHDPKGIEGTLESSAVLGYLPINTTLQIKKQLTHSQGKLRLQADVDNNYIKVTVSGYQIHVGHTEREAGFVVFALLDDGKLGDERLEGCVNADNQMAGSYSHGMFDLPEALQQIIAWAGADTDKTHTYVNQQEHELDRLADACMAHLDWPKINTFITNQINKEQTT
jgi:adenosylcobyric acid synthase